MIKAGGVGGRRGLADERRPVRSPTGAGGPAQGRLVPPRRCRLITGLRLVPLRCRLVAPRRRRAVALALRWYTVVGHLLVRGGRVGAAAPEESPAFALGRRLVSGLRLRPPRPGGPPPPPPPPPRRGRPGPPAPR